MKKLFNFALFGAMALTGAVGFSACSSSDDVVNNPDFDPETNTVKTQFAISIPTSNSQAATRMDADGAPNDGVFKGIKEIHLYPMTVATPTDGSSILAPIELTAIAEGGLDQTGSNGNFKGKVYSDVPVPVNTKSFLFYGEITDEKGGDLTPSYGTSGTTADINFAPTAIQSATFSSIGSDTKGAAVLTALNGIWTTLKAQDDAAAAAAYSQSVQLNALKQSLESLKAGSATTVKAFIENLYNKLTVIDTQAPGNYADNVQDKIDDYFTVGGTSPNNTLTWTTANNFPENVGLPDGAIGLSFTSGQTNPFSFASANVGGGAQPELTVYVKPASLFYTVNTPIHTSKSAHAAQYVNQETWADVVGLYTDATQVNSDTRGIVLDNPIQYGVGRLKSQVKLGGTLKAYNAEQAEVTVSVPSGGYTVSGILIGDQKNVDWKFEPTGSDTYTIYDPVQTGGSSVKATATASTANYTLALQTDKDTPVKVVVELVNDGDAFYGAEYQMIPKGSKFYLAATLTPSSGTGYDEGEYTKNKVFCQDVQTEVTFLVGETSLEHAYNTIPDLRSAKMELGLSVDLNWTEGLKFTDITLGQ